MDWYLVGLLYQEFPVAVLEFLLLQSACGLFGVQTLCNQAVVLGVVVLGPLC